MHGRRLHQALMRGRAPDRDRPATCNYPGCRRPATRAMPTTPWLTRGATACAISAMVAAAFTRPKQLRLGLDRPPRSNDLDQARRTAIRSRTQRLPGLGREAMRSTEKMEETTKHGKPVPGRLRVAQKNWQEDIADSRRVVTGIARQRNRRGQPQHKTGRKSGFTSGHGRPAGDRLEHAAARRKGTAESAQTEILEVTGHGGLAAFAHLLERCGCAWSTTPAARSAWSSVA